MKKYIDAMSFKPKSVLTINQARKNSSKSKAKKTTPRSPQQPNKILRSYNSITNQAQTGQVPFSKSILNRTLNPKMVKKQSNANMSVIHSSMNDVTNKSTTNCLANNGYFMPKSSKS